MTTKSDSDLLKEYAGQASEEAFALLVRRYGPLVYSSALRQTGASGLAEEIAQGVFLLLAKKARSLDSKVMLGGWLLRTTRFMASRARTSEKRRHLREKEATQMQSLGNADEAWKKLAPLLDEGLDRLSEPDRNLLVLRYLEGLDPSDVCARMGLNKEAAKKRQSRALEKLRKFFARHGFSVTSAGIGTLLGERFSEAAPTSLESNIVLALSNGAATSAVSILVEETMRHLWWIKFKLRLAGVGVAGLLFFFAGEAAVGLRFQSPPQAASVEKTTMADASTTLIAANKDENIDPAGLLLRLRVVDAAFGAPVSAVRIRSVVMQNWQTDEKPGLVTDANGEVSVELPKESVELMGLIIGCLKDG